MLVKRRGSHETHLSSQRSRKKRDGRTFDHEKIVNVNFDVSQPVAKALRALRDTGFFGVDCASVAEELLRRVLLSPEIATYWRKP